MKLPYFGQLHLNALDDSYYASIEFENEELGLDLNFKDKSISETDLNQALTIINDLKGFRDLAKKYIMYGYENGSVDVSDYLGFHFDELEKEELNILLKDSDQSLTTEEQILSIVKLRRIGFYPKDPDIYAILDFYTESEISDYLLVVKIDKNFKLVELTWES